MIGDYRPSDEFEGLLTAMCEEGLTDAQARQLEEIVEGDDDACRYYLMYVHLHGILDWNTAGTCRTLLRRRPGYPRPGGRPHHAPRTTAYWRDARTGIRPPTGRIQAGPAVRAANWLPLLSALRCCRAPCFRTP